MGKNLLLLLFVLVSFNFNSFANKFLVESFKADPSDLAAQRFERKDDSDQPCAIIKVMTDIEGLSFESNIAIVGSVEIKPGEYWVYVSPGEKRLRILKKGFVPLELTCSDYNVRIESSSVYVIKVKAETPEGPVIDPAQQKGTLNLSSNPAGANIIIEGEPEFQRVTPYLFEQRTTRPFKITLKKENYESKDTTVQVYPDSVISMNINLTPKVGFLVFRANPHLPTTTISIDGKVVPEIKENEVYPISKGQHKILFDSRSWIPEEKSVNVVLGKTDSLSVNLKPEMGTLSLKITPAKVEKTEVWINNKKSETFAPADFPLQVGDYSILLKKEGYPEKSQNISLSKGDNLNLSFTMLSFEELKKEVRSHKKKQNFWMTSAIVFGAATGYLMMESTNKYALYKEATGANANTLRESIESYKTMAPVTMGLAAFSALEFTIQLSKKGSAKRWLSLETKGTQASLTAKF